MHFTLCPGSTACGYALFPPIHIPDLYPMSIGKSITTPAAIHQSRLSCVSLSQHFEPVYCVPIYPGNKHPVAFKQSIFITAPQFNKCCVEVLIHTCIYIYIHIHSLVLLEKLHQPHLYPLFILYMHVTACLPYLPVATRGRPWNHSPLRLSQVRGGGFHLLPRSRSQCDDSRAMPWYIEMQRMNNGNASIYYASIFLLCPCTPEIWYKLHSRLL